MKTRLSRFAVIGFILSLIAPLTLILSWKCRYLIPYTFILTALFSIITYSFWGASIIFCSIAVKKRSRKGLAVAGLLIDIISIISYIIWHIWYNTRSAILY